jgi:hypothetical protein
MLFKSGLIDPSDLYGALYPYEQKPQPQVRANIMLSTPRDFGPSVFNHAVFGDWRLSVMPIWIRGSYFTWNPLGKQGVRDNLQWPDYALLNARLTKGFRVGRVQIEAYVDAFNVLDQKINNFVAGQAFRNNTDRQNYLASLHLPMYGSPDFDGLRANNPGLYLAGDDQIGDLRSEEKPYINDPDIEMWMYGPPRDIWFGLRILF